MTHNSVSSAMFNPPSCLWPFLLTLGIPVFAEKNLVRYATGDVAIAARKWPCGACRPSG